MQKEVEQYDEQCVPFELKDIIHSRVRECKDKGSAWRKICKSLSLQSQTLLYITLSQL